MKKLSVTELVQSIPSATTSYTTGACDVMQAISLQVVWASSTASFSYQLYASNDGTNFVAVGSSQAILNNSGSTITQLRNAYDFKYYRVTLTKTSGTLTGFNVIFVFEPR